MSDIPWQKKKFIYSSSLLIKLYAKYFSLLNNGYLQFTSEYLVVSMRTLTKPADQSDFVKDEQLQACQNCVNFHSFESRHLFVFEFFFFFW